MQNQLINSKFSSTGRERKTIKKRSLSANDKSIIYNDQKPKIYSAFKRTNKKDCARTQSSQIENRLNRHKKIYSSKDKQQNNTEHKLSIISAIKFQALQEMHKISVQSQQNFENRHKYLSLKRKNTSKRLQFSSVGNKLNDSNNKRENNNLQKQREKQQLSKQQNIYEVQSQRKNIIYAYRTKKGISSYKKNNPNQDNFLIQKNRKGDYFFAVADGHGSLGHQVSKLAIDKMSQYFKKQYFKITAKQLFFKDCCDKIQFQLQINSQINAQISGSTLNCVLIEKDLIVCANVGDSRSILGNQINCKNWEIIHLSEDHKPSVQTEKQRILRRGGKVKQCKDQNGHPIGPQRVWLTNEKMQGLAMSRSFGDNISKTIGVIHTPQLTGVKITKNSRFILLATDGFWQFISNFQILRMVVPFYKERKLEQCCEALLELACNKWHEHCTETVDDITFILIFIYEDQ